MDQHARVTYVNSAFERTFGYRAEEVIGRDLAETIVPPALREAHRRGLALSGDRAERHPGPPDRDAGHAGRRYREFPAEVTVTRTGLPGEATFTGYVRDITDRQRAEKELIASRARLVTASDAARQRVTRDLHDGVQQRLVATLSTSRWPSSAGSRLRTGPGNFSSQALADTRRGIEDLRELLRACIPRSSPSMAWHRPSVAWPTGFAISVEIDVPGKVPGSIEASLYFFCSEALTNIVKHAQATCAWVRLEVAADRCVVEVRDDGIGGARPRPETSGLLGLSDRIGAIAARWTSSARTRRGTVLRAAVPIQPDAAPLAGLQPLSQLPCR